MNDNNRPPKAVRAWQYAGALDTEERERAEFDAAVDTLAETYHEAGFGPERARAMARAVAELPDTEDF